MSMTTSLLFANMTLVKEVKNEMKRAYHLIPAYYFSSCKLLIKSSILTHTYICYTIELWLQLITVNVWLSMNQKYQW